MIERFKLLLETALKAAKLFLRSPLLFLVIQIPEVLGDSLEELLRPYFSEGSYYTLAILVLYTWFYSTLCLVLTYRRALIINSPSNNTPYDISLWEALRRALPATLISWTLSLLGLVVILPGIYFLAVYLFVPLIAVSSPHRLPVSVCLSRSYALARPYFFTLIGFVIFVFIINLGEGHVFFGLLSSSLSFCTFDSRD
jgi:hypothetical protein